MAMVSRAAVHPIIQVVQRLNPHEISGLRARVASVKSEIDNLNLPGPLHHGGPVIGDLKRIVDGQIDISDALFLGLLVNRSAVSRGGDELERVLGSSTYADLKRITDDYMTLVPHDKGVKNIVSAVRRHLLRVTEDDVRHKLETLYDGVSEYLPPETVRVPVDSLVDASGRRTKPGFSYRGIHIYPGADFTDDGLKRLIIDLALAGGNYGTSVLSPGVQQSLTQENVPRKYDFAGYQFPLIAFKDSIKKNNGARGIDEEMVVRAISVSKKSIVLAWPQQRSITEFKEHLLPILKRGVAVTILLPLDRYYADFLNNAELRQTFESSLAELKSAGAKVVLAEDKDNRSKKFGYMLFDDEIGISFIRDPHSNVVRGFFRLSNRGNGILPYSIQVIGNAIEDVGEQMEPTLRLVHSRRG